MNKIEIKDFSVIFEELKLHHLFSLINPEHLNRVLKNSSLVELNSGEKLFERGESYHKGIYIIMKGTILFTRDGEFVTEMSRGDLLGISTFLGKSSYMVDAVAKTDVQLILIPEIFIYNLITDYDSFKIKFYDLVKERINLLQGKESLENYSFSYKPISNFMTTDVQQAYTEATIKDVAKMMAKKNIGSVVIVNKKGKIKGIITSKLIVHRFLSKNNVAFDETVADYMENNPIKIPKEYPLVEVLSEMYLKGQDYAIISENDQPLGIISNNTILRILYRSLGSFSFNIEHASTLDELANIKKNIYLVAKTLIENTRQTAEILPTLSLIHLNIQKKVYGICAQEYLNKTGIKVDEIDHAVIIMGSGARKEMMLNPDQDNGYIFSNNLSDKEIGYLMDFAKSFSDALAYVGYEKCKGGVMASNPDMSRTISSWKKQIDMVTLNAGDKGFTWSNIIFDMDFFHGNQLLVEELRDFIVKTVSERPLFLIQMLENETQFKIPITLFGNFILEKDGEHKGELNLKNSALTFITDIVRAFSLSNKIKELSTVDRLKQLQFKEILSEETVTKVLTAYEIIVDIALNKEIKDAEASQPISKYIDPYSLSVYNQNRLKNALGTITKLLNLSVRYFKGQF
jgi:CBS domain-containing protein